MSPSAPRALDFELLFAALPTPFAALAPDGTILAQNTALAALLGAADLVGQPLAALPAALQATGSILMPPEAWDAGLRAAQASGAAQVLTPEWAGEIPSKAAAAAPSYWEATLQPVHAPAADGQALGELRYLLLRLLDVTTQLRTAHSQAQLQDQRLRIQRILDQIPLTISTMEGPDLAFTFLSAQARATMGARAALGRTVAESMPEITAQGYLQMLQQVRDSGQPLFGHEERTELLDPATGQLQEYYHNFGYLPLHGERGTGVLAYGLDVTEQVQARQRNEALMADARAADQRLRRVTESLPTITFITNQDRQVLYVSPQWFAYTGTAPRTSTGSGWRGCTPTTSPMCWRSTRPPWPPARPGATSCACAGTTASTAGL
ncbi:hypothetical protein AUC43_02635 [Hymenobacter sedentarius]|uniref:PAS domain-containing protein n=1 Tax=Hymenobacter sedentarius TaxID=1411621 RepID=A0A0U4BBY4_9BACT|nr:PAS domain-containing protein [Hymenobacter sedentarius]ALW84091.1 hypothetical protein AUC43_02635 [Hymenobacter sedentarius]